MYSNTDLSGGRLLSGSKWQDRAPFFTKVPENDIRGQAASKFALDDSSDKPYPINQTDEYANIIRYENYRKEHKPTGVDDNDVSHEWIEFIVDTAKWHRQLDGRNTASELKSNLTASLNTYFQIMRKPGARVTHKGFSGEVSGRFTSDNANAKDALVAGNDTNGLLVKIDRAPGNFMYVDSANGNDIAAGAGRVRLRGTAQVVFTYNGLERGINQNQAGVGFPPIGIGPGAGALASNIEYDNINVANPFENTNRVDLGIPPNSHTSTLHTIVGMHLAYFINSPEIDMALLEQIRRGSDNPVVVPAGAPAPPVQGGDRNDQIKILWNIVSTRPRLQELVNRILSVGDSGANVRDRSGLINAILDLSGIVNSNLTPKAVPAEAVDNDYRDRLQPAAAAAAAAAGGAIQGQALNNNGPAGEEETYLNTGANTLDASKLNMLPVSVRYALVNLLKNKGINNNNDMNSIKTELKKIILEQVETIFKKVARTVLEDNTLTIGVPPPGGGQTQAQYNGGVIANPGGAMTPAGVQLTLEGLFSQGNNVNWRNLNMNSGYAIRRLFAHKLRQVGRNLFEVGKPDYQTDIGNLQTAITNYIKDEVNNLNPSFQTLDSNTNEEFMKNVINRWDKLHNNDKTFYKRYMDIVDIQTNNPITDDWGTLQNKSSNELRNYRINMKKDNQDDGSRLTRFAQSLPFYKTDLFKKVWYRKDRSEDVTKVRKAGGGAGTRPQNNRFFERLYMVVFEADPKSNEVNFTEDGQLMRFNNKVVNTTDELFFNWEMDKLLTKMLYDIKKSVSVSQEEDDEDTFEITNQYLKHDTWQRDSKGLFIMGSNNQKLYLNDENNKKEINNLTNLEDNCYSTHYKGKDCDSYLQQCIFADNQEEDLDTCIQFLKKENFGQTLTDEINKLHPITVFKTLKKLGFKAVKVQDSYTNGQTILKVQSYQSWLANLMKNQSGGGLKSSQINQLKNDVLKTYLTYLVEFMNANPQILNENYNGSTMEKEGKVEPPEYTKNLNIPQRREPIDRVGCQRLQTTLRLPGLTTLKLPFGLPFSVGPSIAVPLRVNMVGGKYNTELMYTNNQTGGLVSASAIKKNYGANYLNSLINRAIKQLEQRGKKLSDNSHQKIVSNLNKFIELERSLSRSHSYINLGVKILDALKGMGKTEDRQVFTEKTLQEFVDKNKHLTNKYQNAQINLAAILDALVRATQNVKPDTTTSGRPSATLNLP